MIAKLTENEGVCLDGKWRGWLFRMHPDGQWVSVRKLAEADPMDGNPLAALFSVAPQPREAGGTSLDRRPHRVEPAALAVKPLAWLSHPRDSQCQRAWTAITLGGLYLIEHRHEGHFDLWWPENPSGYRFATEIEARDAAQADHERRILSALHTPAPQPHVKGGR